jgi:hypothetical protein
VHARHGQIEQDQVDLAGFGEPLRQFVEGTGFQDQGVGERCAQSLAQCAPEQRMIIDDDEAIVGLSSHQGRFWLGSTLG